jgi:hypothetical protein
MSILTVSLTLIVGSGYRILHQNLDQFLLYISNQTLVQRLIDDSRASIMRNQEWDPSLPELYPLDLSEFVLRLRRLDSVDGESALRIVHQAEVLASLLNRYHIHVTGWICRVGADLAVNFDEALHDDLLDFAAIEGILETVADEDDQGETVAELVRAR